jgi:hypothetical protein
VRSACGQIVGVRVQGAELQLGVVIAGHHEHGELGVVHARAQRRADLEAVAVRQVDVEQQQVGIDRLEQGQDLDREPTALGHGADAVQPALEQAHDLRLVLDDDDPRALDDAGWCRQRAADTGDFGGDDALHDASCVGSWAPSPASAASVK